MCVNIDPWCSGSAPRRGQGDAGDGGALPSHTGAQLYSTEDGECTGTVYVYSVICTIYSLCETNKKN